MREVVFDRFGPPEVLRLVERPDPVPDAGQVRVRVRSVGVQPFDAAVRRGAMDVPIRFPQGLGNEFSGVVDRIGIGVTGVAEGDEVLGWAPLASLADYVVVEPDAFVRKPASMPWNEAGAIGASGQTALTALRELGVGPGDTLLVHAAAGGAGTAAVQLARARGARVLGTASAANHGYLASLGAVPISYGPGLIDRVRASAPDGVDAALDAIGGDALRDSLDLVADRQRIGTLVDHAEADRLGVLGIRAVRSTDQLRELTALHEQGAFQVTLRARFPLEDVAAAHREIESGHGRGKVVVEVSG